METLIISVERAKEIAEHASSELPKEMDADVYAKEVCNTVFEVILHQIIQKAYYEGIIASEQRWNDQLKDELDASSTNPCNNCQTREN